MAKSPANITGPIVFECDVVDLVGNTRRVWWSLTDVWQPEKQPGLTLWVRAIGQTRGMASPVRSVALRHLNAMAEKSGLTTRAAWGRITQNRYDRTARKFFAIITADVLAQVCVAVDTHLERSAA